MVELSDATLKLVAFSAVPFNEAVIVPAEKLPLPSRATTLDAVAAASLFTEAHANLESIVDACSAVVLGADGPVNGHEHGYGLWSWHGLRHGNGI